MAIGSPCWSKDDLDIEPCDITAGESSEDASIFIAGGGNPSFYRKYDTIFRCLRLDSDGLLRDPLLSACRAVPCSKPPFFQFKDSGNWDSSVPGSEFWRLGLSMWAIRNLDTGDGAVCIQNVGTLHYLGAVGAPSSNLYSPFPTGTQHTEDAGFAPLYPAPYDQTRVGGTCRRIGLSNCPTGGALRCFMKARMYALPPYARRRKWKHYKTGAVRWIPMSGIAVDQVQGYTFKNVMTGEYLQLMDRNPMNSVLTTGDSETFEGANFFIDYTELSSLPSGSCAPCGTPLSIAEYNSFMRAFASGVLVIPRSIYASSSVETSNRWSVVAEWNKVAAPLAATAPALIAMGRLYPAGTTPLKQDLAATINQAYIPLTQKEIMDQINSLENAVALEYNTRVQTLHASGGILELFEKWSQGSLPISDPSTKFILGAQTRATTFGGGPSTGTVMTFSFMTYIASLVRAFADCYGDNMHFAFDWSLDKNSVPIHAIPISAVPYTKIGTNLMHSAMIREITLGREPKYLKGPQNLDPWRVVPGGEWLIQNPNATEGKVKFSWPRPVSVARVVVRLYQDFTVSLWGQENLISRITAEVGGAAVPTAGSPGRTAQLNLNSDGSVSPMPFAEDIFAGATSTWKCPKQKDPSLLSWWMFPQLGHGKGEMAPSPPPWLDQEEFSPGGFYGPIVRTQEAKAPAYLVASAGTVDLIPETHVDTILKNSGYHWWMRPESAAPIDGSTYKGYYRILTPTPSANNCIYTDQPFTYTGWMALTLNNDASARPNRAQGDLMKADPKMLLPWVMPGKVYASPLGTRSLCEADAATERQLFRWVEGSPQFPGTRILECKAFPFRKPGEPASLSFPDAQLIWDSAGPTSDLKCDAFYLALARGTSTANPTGIAYPPIHVREVKIFAGSSRALGYIGKLGIDTDPATGKKKWFWPYRIDGLGSAFSNCVKVHADHDPANNKADSTYAASFVDVGRSELRRLGGVSSRLLLCYTADDDEDDVPAIGAAAQAAGALAAAAAPQQNAAMPAAAGVALGAAGAAGMDAAAGIEAAPHYAGLGGGGAGMLAPPAPAAMAAAVAATVPTTTTPEVAAAAEQNAMIAAVAGEGVGAGPPQDQPAQDLLLAEAADISSTAGHYAGSNASWNDYAGPDPVNPQGVAPLPAVAGGGQQQNIIDTIVTFFAVGLGSMFGSLPDVAHPGGGAAAAAVPGAPVRPDAAWSMLLQLAVFAGMMANAHNVALGILHQIQETMQQVVDRIIQQHPDYTPEQAHALLGEMQNALPYQNFLIPAPAQAGGAITAPGLAAAGYPLSHGGGAGGDTGGAGATNPAGQGLWEYFNDVEDAVGLNINHAADQAVVWTGILSFLLCAISLAAQAAHHAGGLNGPRAPNGAQVAAAVGQTEAAIRSNNVLPFPAETIGHFISGQPQDVFEPLTYLIASDEDQRAESLGVVPGEVEGAPHVFRFPELMDPQAFLAYDEDLSRDGSQLITPQAMIDALDGVELSGLLQQGNGTFQTHPLPGQTPVVDQNGPIFTAVHEFMGIAQWINNNAQGFLGTPPAASDGGSGGSGGTMLSDLFGPIAAIFQSYNTDSNPYHPGQGQVPLQNQAWYGMINPSFLAGMPGAVAPGYGGGHAMHPPSFMSLMAGTWHTFITTTLFNIYQIPEADFFAATDPAHGAMAPNGADSLNGLITFMLALAAGVAPPYHGMGGA